MIPEKGGLVTCPECAVKILIKKDGAIDGIWKKQFSVDELFSEIILKKDLVDTLPSDFNKKKCCVVKQVSKKSPASFLEIQEGDLLFTVNNNFASMIDLNDFDIYRDLSKPVGALNPNRLVK